MSMIDTEKEELKIDPEIKDSESEEKTDKEDYIKKLEQSIAKLNSKVDELTKSAEAQMKQNELQMKMSKQLEGIIASNKKETQEKEHWLMERINAVEDKAEFNLADQEAVIKEAGAQLSDWFLKVQAEKGTPINELQSMADRMAATWKKERKMDND